MITKLQFVIAIASNTPVSPEQPGGCSTLTSINNAKSNMQAEQPPDKKRCWAAFASVRKKGQFYLSLPRFRGGFKPRRMLCCRFKYSITI